MSPKEITSPSNPTIKELVRLKDRKSDGADKEFLVEGFREIDRAIRSGFEILELFVCHEVLSHEAQGLMSQCKNITFLSLAAFQKIAIREKSDGVLAVFAIKEFTLREIASKTTKPILIVAVEALEKPGNLGAVLRSADAAKVDCVVVLDQKVDTWNQNVIRSSLGAVFSVPVINCTSQQLIEWCKENDIKTFGAALSNRSKSIFESELKGPSAIIFGSEAFGLSTYLLENVDDLSVIPMAGICDSLNISVAAAIYMFEAVRQRSLV